MSFFDDDDFEEPTHIADETPQRGARRGLSFGGLGRGATSGSGGGPGMPDPHTARVRQLSALGILVVVCILLVVAVSSCVSNGRKSALRDYSRDVTAVLAASSDEVAKPLFSALSSGDGANVLQPAVNNLRVIAEQQATRAEGFNAPGDDAGRSAQHDLEMAMNFRARAVRIIAERIPAALADGQTSEAAVNDIAGQMQVLLSSDVVLLLRTKPLIDEALADADISGAEIDAPRSVPNVSWLQPDTVASNLGGAASSGGSGSGGGANTVADRSDEEPATPGSHGTGVVGTSMGGNELQSGTDNAVTGTEVAVQVANQGDSDESNIEVGVTFTPSGGGRPAFKKGRIPALTAGQTGSITIPLPNSVRSGQSGELKVEVGGVPGEQTLDNNTATYDVTIGG
ncbi:MAG: hypothetical protein ITG02_05870 [Patulibacter sp.]|nr:hypothetical protein [Patulibacter sp.]